MLDWQAQQKALKDKERMSKKETEQMLQNYRGDTDEISSKLSSLKQEDRKNKQEAARLLHNYRGTADAVGSATKSPKRPEGGKHVLPTDLDTLEDTRQGEESVAALAAGFSQNGVQDSAPVMQQQYEGSSPESLVMVDNTPSTSTNGSPPLAAVAPGQQETVQASREEGWVSVESSTVPSPEVVEDILAESATKDLPTDQTPGSFDSGEDTMSRAVTEVADNLDDDDMDDDEDTVLTEAQVHASVSGGGHLSLRLDVEFSFGLVSNDLTPNTEKYMKAVANIAHSLFSENRPAGTGGHAIYNADFEPFVRLVEDDYTYVGAAGTRRQVVHASLPMFIIDWAEATSTREGVKNVLKTSIQEGSFLRLALEAR